MCCGVGVKENDPSSNCSLVRYNHLHASTLEKSMSQPIFPYPAGAKLVELLSVNHCLQKKVLQAKIFSSIK